MPPALFEDFLETKFYNDYHGDKEHYEDAFEEWLWDLGHEDYVRYADEALEQLAKITCKP